MTITTITTTDVVNGAQQINMSDLFSVTASASNPKYLIVNALDRNEYTVGATGVLGSFIDNKINDNFTSTDASDGRGASIVFTYDPTTGQYVNSLYGNFNQLSYNSSSNLNDVTALSVYTTNTLPTSSSAINSPYNLAVMPGMTYVGTTTIANQPSAAAVKLAQATPNSVIAAAQSFVGQAWNKNGCWVLASTIAAEAGAGLPVDSTMLGKAGQTNGEWFCVFDGTKTPTATNWRDLVTAGEIVTIGTGSSGHITTCVSGTGSTAMLIDNMTVTNAYGLVQNSAKDGSANDIIVQVPHLASQEFTSSVLTSMVKIYELDCPIVTQKVSSYSMNLKATALLSSLVNVTDPAGTALASYQVYDTNMANYFVNGSSTVQAHNAATACTVSSLSNLCFTGAVAGTDTLTVRAKNANGYWGDWQSLTVSVNGFVAPIVANKTADQVLTANKAFSIALASNTFTDPNGQALTYSATSSDGTSLPSWLLFDSKTDTFSGTAPTTLGSKSIMVKATDTSGLSVTETFNLGLTAAAPKLAVQTANQTWKDDQLIALTLPVNTFTDPQGEALTYTATQSNGQALPSWLTFDAKTETFSGKVPTNTSGSLSLAVTATDASGLSVTDTFMAALVAPPKVSLQMANMTLVDGNAFNQSLANSITDPNGQVLTYTATQNDGSALPSWMTFDKTKLTLSGTAPTTGTGSVNVKLTATNASGLSTSESFLETLTAPPKETLTLALQTATQTWKAGQQVNFSLDAKTFVDNTKTFSTLFSQLTGPTTSSWLKYNNATQTFSGTVPKGLTGTAQMCVVAASQSGLTAQDKFNVVFTG